MAAALIGKLGRGVNGPVDRKRTAKRLVAQRKTQRMKESRTMPNQRKQNTIAKRKN